MHLYRPYISADHYAKNLFKARILSEMGLHFNRIDLVQVQPDGTYTSQNPSASLNNRNYFQSHSIVIIVFTNFCFPSVCRTPQSKSSELRVCGYVINKCDGV